MGAICAILKCGDEAQRRLAVPLVLGGDKPAICITEPDAGSAATDMHRCLQIRTCRNAVPS